jgi:two-component system sensor histidine kinase PhoQ
LLFAASLVLIFFLGLTGWLVDRAFRESAETSIKERLQVHISAVIAASDLRDDGTMEIRHALLEPRFDLPGSGLYARVVRIGEGGWGWSSKSALGLDIPYLVGLHSGEQRFQIIHGVLGSDLIAYHFVASYELGGRDATFIFSVAESLERFYAQVGGFRRTLWGWLGGVTVALLVVQGFILKWGLSPLRRVADDLTAIEKGETTHLEGRYPRELQGLTGNLNALIRSEREHLNRYRHTLSDLAHSLKTPLAVLQGELEKRGHDATLQSTAGEQVSRMRQIIDYQLQKAAASGRTTLSAPVSIVETAQRILGTMNKVYADKNVAVKLEVDTGLVYSGDKDDLLELMGNLIENAFKWCRTQVVVSGRKIRSANNNEAVMEICIEDDGPGIPADMIRSVLQRGIRADERTSGHGIGLAIVREIVHLYEGRLDIGKSALGGAKMTVTLPV